MHFQSYFLKGREFICFKIEALELILTYEIT